MKNKNALALILLVCTGIAVSQDEFPTKVTVQSRSGDLPFAATIGSSYDTVDVFSGNLTINVPIVSVPGRGAPFNFSLRYDNRFLSVVRRDSGGSTYEFWNMERRPYIPDVDNGLWSTSVPALSFVSRLRDCGMPQGPRPGEWDIGSGDDTVDYIYHDSSGAKHPLRIGTEHIQCYPEEYSINNLVGPDTTGAGLLADITDTPKVTLGDGTANSVTSQLPGRFMQTGVTEYYYLLGKFVDTNGNIKYQIPGGSDSIGRVPLRQNRISTNQLDYITKDASGTDQHILVAFIDKTISTSFGLVTSWGAPVGEFNGTRKVISSITLPDQRSYQFTYDSYGSITRIDLPTGGAITYQWSNFGSGEYAVRVVTARTEISDGVQRTWTINFESSVVCGNSSNSKRVTLNAPNGEQTIYCGGQQVHNVKARNSGAAPILREYEITYQTTDWQNLTDDLPNSITTTLDGVLFSRKEFTYDLNMWDYYRCPGPVFQCTADPNQIVNEGTWTSRGNVKEIREYDWNAGSGATPLRVTKNQYLHETTTDVHPLAPTAQQGQAAATANIVDKIWRQTVSQGTATTAADTAYGYDSRGNTTHVSKWRNLPSSSWLDTVYSYDGHGNITSITDPLQHSTYFRYSDNWSTNGCGASAGSGAYITEIENAKGHVARYKYYGCNGLIGSKIDPNNSVTSFTYDNLNRVSSQSNADGGVFSTTYSTDRRQVTRQLVSLGQESRTLNDPFGREIQTGKKTSANQWAVTDTCYDLNGRRQYVTNPYYASTFGFPLCAGPRTSMTYDALGRLTVMTQADGSYIQNIYAANVTDVIDEATTWRRTSTDALGRLSRVFEYGTLYPQTSPAYETQYRYDILGNLTCVEQHGNVTSSRNCDSPADPALDATSPWRIRRFTYDSLSQLLLVTNPESGSVCYGEWSLSNCISGYDAAGRLLKKTDARRITVSYLYDELNRLTGKMYSNGDPAVSYSYDSTAGSNPGIGRRTAMTDGSGATAWAYDTMGRSTQVRRTIATVGKNIGYGYQVDGSIATVLYPSNAVVSYSYDVGGRPTLVRDSAHNLNFASNISYEANGELSSANLGASISVSNTYNSRLQLNTMSAVGTAGSLMSRTYDFHEGSGDNGNVYGIVDNLDSLNIPNRPVGSETFSYDGLNRISAAQSTGMDCSLTEGVTKNWGNTYTIDPWGNLTNKTVLKCSAELLNESVGNDNRLSGAARYDAAGNMVSGGLYVFNAENQIVSGGGETYRYDGDGNRVSKIGPVNELHWLGADSETLAESDAAGNLTSEYVFFGGKRVARIDSNDLMHPKYYISDHLGSASVIASDAGVSLGETMYFPYGGERWSNLADSNHYKFTGKERDSETGLDYFGARYYGSSMGRWMSPDWAANATAVPYAQFGDPQTLNLYGYVRNNPLGTADLDGHGEWYDVKGKHLGTDGVDNGAVVVANGKVSYSSDHSLIDMSSSDKPLASFSKAEGAAMHDAVNRSNAPTSDDKTGGMHEEGFGTTKGQITNAPPGAAYKPGDDHIQITVPTTADTTLKVHVHPEGRGNVQVQQTPSDRDRNNVDPMARPNMTNVVVGAGSGKVYIYDQKGTKAEIPLKVFPKDKE